MAQSHGMSTHDYELATFIDGYETLSPVEQQGFLIDSVNEFVQKVEYPKEPVRATDVWIAIKAAEILMNRFRDSEHYVEPISPSQIYLIERFFGLVDEVCKKLQIDSGIERIEAKLADLKAEQQESEMFSDEMLLANKNTPLQI